MSRSTNGAVVSHAKRAATKAAGETARSIGARRSAELLRSASKGRSSDVVPSDGSSDSRELRLVEDSRQSASRDRSERRIRSRSEDPRSLQLRRRGISLLRGPSRSEFAKSSDSRRQLTPANESTVPVERAAVSLPAIDWNVVEARAGDHPSIYQWLLAVFHAPSRQEFHAQHDDPTYEPRNRLLVKRGTRLVSHAQIVRRTMLFGPLQLPVDQLAWVGTLPEFRRQGAASRLLETADEQMRAHGAALGVLRTRVPHFFHRAGWAVCGRHCSSRAKTAEILARYCAEPALRTGALNIRLWRHFELPALMRLYAQNTTGMYGPLDRSEPYWRWLISRAAFDHIVIALAGPDRLDLTETLAPIVGYAVVRQERIVELLTNPAYPTARYQLLARCCADAIERRGSEIVLEAPCDDPLHRFVQSAGGAVQHRESDGDEVFMVKLFNEAGFLARLMPLIEARARAAHPSETCELGLLVDGDKFLLAIGRRGTTISRERLGRSYIACNRCEFTRLLLGHSSPADAAAQGRLTASTQTALDLAEILFPRLPAWRPPWDDLAA
jgi:GNAT superfamily N-acetyltransferase